VGTKTITKHELADTLRCIEALLKTVQRSLPTSAAKGGTAEGDLRFPARHCERALKTVR